MQALIPILTSVGSSLAGGLVGKLFGGGGGGSQNLQKNVAAKPKALFNPQQIRQATDKYTTENTAKWNQILANMGAGGGLGGADLGSQIGTQAESLSKALGGLTTESGYGDNPMANLEAILKGMEGGISPKYSLY